LETVYVKPVGMHGEGVSMPRHEDMDFAHAAVWCDDCWDSERQAKMLAEMRRANDLKEVEINMRDQGDWIEERPRPRPTYVLSAPPPTPQPSNRLKWGQKGGMNIEPAG